MSYVMFPIVTAEEAGAAAGGEGIEKVIQVLEPATLSLVTERRVSRPWGLSGGGPGAGGGQLAVARRRRVQADAAAGQGDGALGCRGRRADPHTRVAGGGAMQPFDGASSIG